MLRMYKTSGSSLHISLRSHEEFLIIWNLCTNLCSALKTERAVNFSVCFSVLTNSDLLNNFIWEVLYGWFSFSHLVFLGFNYVMVCGTSGIPEVRFLTLPIDSGAGCSKKSMCQKIDNLLCSYLKLDAFYIRHLWLSLAVVRLCISMGWP